ncbi:olfactory receptor 11H4-like [Poecilia latipinna]|uniref:olfactory receptor 11H4-like n=1 Tax=Poecilia mexicana TaxID=48701 RepID=UPI00072DF965|nr:PREDICTED: olfactory receptor 11H4-like [Poecilia mexicana]XP_014877661.1 PREDICTED: olfactory receptor 11H4-like [Poecilia latipinna]
MNTTATRNKDPLHIAILKSGFTVVFSLSIIYINGILIHIFRKHQVFNMNSRYILYIHLVVNDIIMLALMVLLIFLSQTVFTINVSFCIIVLIFAISSNLNNPLTLAAMALECYLAICFPLRHPQICTVRKTYIVISLIWFLSSLTILPDLFAVVATRPATYFNSRIFCLWANIFTDPQLEKKRDVSNIIYLVTVWLVLFYAYFRILFTAQAASTNAKKARNTVLLHGFQLLLCMLSYVHSIMIEGIIKFFPGDALIIRFVISLLIQVTPRLISPIVYGIRDKLFREYLKRYFLPSNKATINPGKTGKKPT